MSNRLASERSPYLLQHADNPVQWYPWGDEAFARARAEDKPIFLSVGYSTCHWCHVMAHESFESAAVAEVLNRDFVAVKVDREERPDIDRVYMLFVQATTGQGGWPMSVWLTPALEPFYGGTYFPPDGRWGRPGFKDVLESIAAAWRDDRQRVLTSAIALVENVRRAADRSSGAGGTEIAAADQLTAGVKHFEMAYDARRGGFGDGPKFPRPSELLFLLREHARTGHTRALEMARHSLQAMALGGMRDHVGGGFHRYSVDGEWRVPHFEKMLYDQAQLVIAYLEAAQVTGEKFFAQVAEDTLQYVGRELTSPEGGFYSAEDADSRPPEQAGDPHAHAVEGAFYVWSVSELREVLGDDADVFGLRFGVEEGGNAPSDPHGEFVGKNILYTARTLEEIAASTAQSQDEIIERLARSRLAAYAARLRRPRPHLDDKILAAWNGLMIAAFARASRVLRHPGFGLTEAAASHLATAQRAARFLRDALWDEEHRVLKRRYREGEAGVDGYAEDYASVAFGLLELFQADGDVAWLEWADALQRELDARFWDPDAGGWFSTTGEDPSVLVRLKDEYDGAEPSAGAVACLNLLTLTRLRPDAEREARLSRALARFGQRLGEVARIVPLVSAAVSTWHAGVGQIVIASSDGAAGDLVATIARHYLPFAVVIPIAPGSREALAQALPFVASLPARDGGETAYVCRDFVCQAPAGSAAELEEALRR